MVPSILVCTICRNLETNFKRYYSQLRHAVTHLSDDYNFYFSVYENDSTDATKKLLSQADWSFFKNHAVTTEDLNVPKFSGGNEMERVRILATARNKCIEAGGLYKNVDWIIFVESDIEYTNEMFKKILEHGGQDVDIFSGIAVTKGTKIIYDLWATRYTSTHRDNENTVYDLEPLGLRDVWATFSCLCLYKAEPFKKGVRFHWMNTRLGTHDCDTTVICENFREAGYDKIRADYSINPEHPAENLIAYAIHPGKNAHKLAHHIRSIARRTDDVVITDYPKTLKTREYIFELWADDLPSRMLLHFLQFVHHPMFDNKPSIIHVPIMKLDFVNLTVNSENGATDWPLWEPRIFHSSPEKSYETKLIPNGALCIWKINDFT